MKRLSCGLPAAILCAGFAGCGSKDHASVCDLEPTRAECTRACDPMPGAPATCPAGFHCSPDGACDSQCATAAECGDGYACTADGRCIDDGTIDPPLPDAACPDVVFTPMPKTPSIMLVLDQSGSMYKYDVGGGDLGVGNGCLMGPDPASCRFRAMREALVHEGTGVVSQLEGKAYFGASLYTCGIVQQQIVLVNPRVGRSLDNAGAIRALIDSKISIIGQDTPTHAALDAAVDGFIAEPPPADSPPVIVLATDGEPNSCAAGTGANGGEAATVEAARNAYAAGIPVYVLAIGIDGPHFQDVANAGQGWQSGQPNVPYYPVANAAQLQAAFQRIINGVISCDLGLTGAIYEGQASSGSLTLNGEPLQYGTDWILVGDSTIRVQGAACTTLTTTASPTVEASFPCGAVIL